MEEKRIGSQPPKKKKKKTVLEEYEEQLRKENEAKAKQKHINYSNIESFKERDERKVRELNAEINKRNAYIEYLKQSGASQEEIDDEIRKRDKAQLKKSDEIQKNWENNYTPQDGFAVLDKKKEVLDEKRKKTNLAINDSKAKYKSLLAERDAALKNKDETKLKILDRQIHQQEDLINRQEERYKNLTEESKKVEEHIKVKDNIVHAPSNMVKAVGNKAKNAVQNTNTYQTASKTVSETKQKVNNTKPVRFTKTKVQSAKKLLGNSKNALSGAMNNAKNAVKKGVNHAAKVLGKAIIHTLNAIGTFLISNPVGWAILVILAILVFVIIGSVNGVKSANEAYRNFDFENVEKVPTEAELLSLEYKAWLETYKDEEKGEGSFYEDYRQVITADKVAVIGYVFKDPKLYDELRSDMNYEHYIKHSKNTMEELTKLNEEILKKYYEEFDVVDKYTLRQLYLDKIDYQYSYLYREYTEWEKPTIPSEISKDKIQEFQDNSKSEADKHDESIPYQAKATVYWFEEVDDYEYVTKIVFNPTTGKNEEVKVLEKTGSHQEKRTETVDITLYKYRDVIAGSEMWYPNPNEFPKISETVNKGMEHSRPTCRATLPPVLVEDAEWIKIYYGGNGLATKRVKYWKLKTYEEVVDLLIYHYNPETKDDKYKGDSFTLSFVSEIDSSDNRTITIDKKKLYPLYYAKRTSVNKEALFSDEWIDDWKAQLNIEKIMFQHYANSVDFQLAEGKFLISPFVARIEDASKNITQHFNEDLTGANGGGNHEALDIAVAYQTDINAAIGGTVVKVHNTTPENTSNICYKAPNSAGCHGVNGNQVVVESKIVDTAGNEHTLRNVYYHIYVGSATVSEGDTVEAGQIIAKEGHNGLSSGPHLHWELWVDGKKVDQEPYTQWTSSGEYVSE